MVQGLFAPATEKRPELHALIVRFSGSSEASRAFGLDVGLSLRDSLEAHARDVLRLFDTGLQARAIRVKFVPCTVTDHEHARKLGLLADADVVLWGQAFCRSSDPKACRTVAVQVHVEGANSHNSIQNSPGATMNNVVQPIIIVPQPPSEAQGSFTTSLTVVRWAGLESSAGSQVRVKRLDDVSAMSLPRLVSKRPRLLLDVVLGLYAARADRHALAAEFFQRTRNDLSAGVEGSHELLLLIGRSYLIAGQKDAGLAALEAAVRSCMTQDRACRQVALRHSGWAQERTDNLPRAMQMYEDSLALAQELGNELEEAALLNGLGRLHSSLGDKQKALRFYARALSLREKGGDLAGQAWTLNNIGWIHAGLGDKRQALAYYERALPLAQRAGDLSNEAMLLNNLGRVHAELGDTHRAIELLNRALPLKQKVGDLIGEAMILHNLGKVHAERGDKAQAVEYYARALPLRQRVGDASGEGSTLKNLAQELADLGRTQEAIRRYHAAAAAYLRRSPPDSYEAANCLDEALRLAASCDLFLQAAALRETLGRLRSVAITRFR